MTVAIREPTPQDVVRLHELICEHAAFERSTASLTREELERLVLASPPPIHFLVAARDDGPLGYVAVSFDWSVWRARRYAHLNCLFVAEAHRGHGIGKNLLAEAKRFASAEGADRMEWQTPAWNEDARRFYIREGAECQAKTLFNLSLAQATTQEPNALL